ncbi:N(2)-fixation sustaining protein CowN [Sulfurospirillum sp. T05]|uniref:N(2)-fixation sustaining protein CowN n=1 Tax=Sulfurospirillum tamanense TaxID=2813362 RepID=A0ABS2WUW5_9BACT|nr:N(2)-fixation sustaining protein CowN [Sulfurospirillum tamanensis]MBN2965444.1 N(2)-fixation sustaining protein CowN [Sulfurospirillum tamanensis]
MERYVSFENIDCFENACCVVDEVLFLLKEKPEATNPFWEKFVKKIPPAYYTRTPDEDVLYLVCANVFYLEELFENHDHEEGLLAMEKAEIECC